MTVQVGVIGTGWIGQDHIRRLTDTVIGAEVVAATDIDADRGEPGAILALHGELLPVFEREGIALNLEPHPDDFCEQNSPGVDLVRAINKPWVNYLYCAPHTFHLSDGAGDIEQMLRYAGPKLRHLHIADSFNHKGSSGLRYIMNPPGTAARMHQHLDIDQGEVNWDVFFSTLLDLDFDGVATVCVFAWEERARESLGFNLERVSKELG